MAKKEKFSNRRFNDLHDTSDPDFDLDEYIREQSLGHDGSTLEAPVLDKDESYQFKNAVLIFIVFAAAFLWFNEWSPRQAIGALFGSDNTAENSFVAPDVNIDLPEINIPSPPSVSTTDGSGFADYLAGAREAGFSDLYSNTGLRALYQTGVPLDYISDLVQAGYQEFSYSAVIGLYNGGVTIDYLNNLSENGYLNQYSYSGIIGLYNGGVTVDYLKTLSDNNYLERFSYSAVIGLYNGGVSADYLDQLSEGGYLDLFSYSAIIGMYNSGVTVDYINQLNERDLLNDMSYSDIIVAYNTDN